MPQVLEALGPEAVADPEAVELALGGVHDFLRKVHTHGRDCLDVFHVHVSDAVAGRGDLLRMPLKSAIVCDWPAEGKVQGILEHLVKVGAARIPVVPVHVGNAVPACTPARKEIISSSPVACAKQGAGMKGKEYLASL